MRLGILLVVPISLYLVVSRLSVINREWEEVEREREGRRKEVERARQEIETRRRIEARLRAKQEAEGRARRESTENGEWVGICECELAGIHLPNDIQIYNLGCTVGNKSGINSTPR